jgi:hypothetical protein
VHLVIAKSTAVVDVVAVAPSHVFSGAFEAQVSAAQAVSTSLQIQE